MFAAADEDFVGNKDCVILIQIFFGNVSSPNFGKKKRISWWPLLGFSARIRKVNLRGFRHLNEGLGLHQGFQGFSYK